MNPTLSISTDKTLLDINMIHHFLGNESYWAQNITIKEVTESINSSLCFGLFLNNMQIGFARLITDNTTFGYLCDLFIIASYRKKGYSKILMKYIMAHNVVKKLKKLLLITADAHFLYERFGFINITKPEQFMELNQRTVSI